MPTATATVPFLHLVIQHHEVGTHRGRRFGFREVFGLGSLQDTPFVMLAMKVKQAYEHRRVPAHEGWPAQREALQWLVDRGKHEIYALDGDILLKRTPLGRYYIDDGHHRALALYVLGEPAIRAKLVHGISASRRARW